MRFLPILFLVFLFFCSPVLAGTPGSRDLNALAAAEKGDEKSLAELKTRAQEGDIIAQKRLGDLYINDGVKKSSVVKRNNAEALKWYLMAAKQGDRNAQRGLVFIYQTGIDVPKDDVETYFWLRILGYKDGQKWHKYAPVKKRLSPQLIIDVDKRVKEFKPPPVPAKVP